MEAISIYKFGGASVKDANGVRNLIHILRQAEGRVGVVVSAMGKTTNALEKIIELYEHGIDFSKEVMALVEYHYFIINDLFGERTNGYTIGFDKQLKDFNQELLKKPTENKDANYDRIIAYGELFSTSIISGYLEKCSILHSWLDARALVSTSSDFREGKVNWELTSRRITEQVKGIELFITQGFIGADLNGNTVTLGREGSDFTAAVFGACVGAKNVTIWKDVEGVLNADPGWYKKAGLMPELSYNEAVEQAFYGASIIHPKTIKPLENKMIPLYVRSFVEPEKRGTLIHKSEHIDYPPVIIRKTNLVLVTIASTDFSFIVEENLQEIFACFSKHYAKVQIMENSALKFSACIKVRPERLNKIQESLMQKYRFSYNTGVSLFTIRHYNDSIIDEVIEQNEVLMEQKNRSTAWFVVR